MDIGTIARSLHQKVFMLREDEVPRCHELEGGIPLLSLPRIMNLCLCVNRFADCMI